MLNLWHDDIILKNKEDDEVIEILENAQLPKFNKGKLEYYFSEIENYRIQYTNKCPNIKNSKNKYCNPETGEIISLCVTDNN